MLSELFSSQARLRVIEELFYGEASIGVRAIAKKAGASPALVSGTIKILKKEGLVKDNKIDLLNPFAKAIKILLNIQKIKKTRIIQNAMTLFKGCDGIGLYGSWANGTNTFESDLDLWIKTETPDDVKAAKLVSMARERLGVEANILLLTEKKLKELKEKDFVFYCALHNSFVLWGEGV